MSAVRLAAPVPAPARAGMRPPVRAAGSRKGRARLGATLLGTALAAAASCGAVSASVAQVLVTESGAGANGTSPAGGSLAFCLVELPGAGEGRRTWINLGIVQYVELREAELRLFYGGGNFGAGHEARVPLRGQDGVELIRRLQAAARGCR